MEFCEKLQMLRKNKGITQEELAEELYVSRTAVSKWESGRGYPNIESLRDLSKYFSVSIDDLLSADKLIFIAEKENKENIVRICDFVSGIADLFSFVLIVLPLYPNEIQGFVYSVNLINYTQISPTNLAVYWALYILIFAFGAIKLISVLIKAEKAKNIISVISICLNVFMVIFLALAREAYAVVVAFLLLTVKAAVLFRTLKSK